MNEKSPFEQWRENHLNQIVVSPEILKLIAEAFQGGRLYEMKPPKQRTWIGLDAEEIRKTDHHMVTGAYHYSFRQGARWAEETLKERNT
jgi:hypothetical protein